MNMQLAFVFFFLVFYSVTLQSQKDGIPVDPQLANNSEAWLIKIGMITAKAPPKVRFGDYSTTNRKGASESIEGSQFFSGESRSEGTLQFSFDLVGKDKESVHAEAIAEPGPDGKSENVSVYMASSLDPDDMWILLISKDRDTGSLSLASAMLTNGESEITFAQVFGEPTGKEPETAPKGIELFYEGQSVAAMQYDSGGSFAYRKFIRISDRAERQVQWISGAALASILEIGSYFNQSTIDE